jgi:replicative DNA helicase
VRTGDNVDEKEQKKEESRAEHNRRVEKAAIADILNGNNEQYSDARIDQQHFIVFKNEFNFIKRFKAKHGGIPSHDTFREQFPAMELPTELDPTHFIIDQLAKKYMNGMMVPEVQKLVNLINEGRLEDGLAEFEKKLNEVSGVDHRRIVNVFSEEEIDKRQKLYIERLQHPERMITFGFKEWDDLTGGQGEADLSIIAGRPSGGKSVTALKSAYEVSKAGYKVAYFNGEMADSAVEYKLDTFVTGISNFGINKGKAFVRDSYLRMIEAIKQLPYQFILLSKDDVKDKITPTYLEKFCKRNQIECLYLDQFSLLDSESRMKRDAEISWELVKELKNMQKRLKIPVVLLAQIKRPDKKAPKKDAGDPKYDLEDMGKSRGLEEFASNVVLLDQLYEKDDQGRSIVNYFFGKTRDGAGRGNTLQYAWDFDKGKVWFMHSTVPIKNYPDVPSVAQKIQQAQSYAPDEPVIEEQPKPEARMAKITEAERQMLDDIGL